MLEPEQSPQLETDKIKPGHELNLEMVKSGFEPPPVDPGPVIRLVDGKTDPARWLVNDRYCYDDDDLERRKKQLEKEGVKYTVEEVAPPAGLYITEGIKYSTVEEALKHIEGVTPESLIIPRLKEQLATAEEWLGVALTKLTEIETVKMVELSDKVRVLEEAAVKEEIVKEETIIKR